MSKTPDFRHLLREDLLLWTGGDVQKVDNMMAYIEAIAKRCGVDMEGHLGDE